MGTLEEVGSRLVYILLKEAKRRGAEAVITVCPFCQFNLECFQDKVSGLEKEDLHIPVLFFTQLMGVALGLPKKALGLQRLFTPFIPPAERKGGRHARQR